ncbi:MAG: hypothetical protein HQK99_15010 [Nitrospirae bacterium]|nr:hypothetical protein [Nitrospirota bacterium]
MIKFNVVLFFLSSVFLLFASTQDVYANGNDEAITTNAAASGNYTATQTQVGSSSTISVTYTAAIFAGAGFDIPSTTDSITAGSSEYSIISDTCAAGFSKSASCTITVRYTPTSVTSSTGTLRVILTNPGGGVFYVANGPFTTNSGSGVGNSNLTTTVTLNPNATAMAAPTMNEWGMIIFMVTGGVASVYYLRKNLYN